MPTFLLTTAHGRFYYVIAAYLIGIVLSFSLGFVIHYIHPIASEAKTINFNIKDFIGLVLFAPIIETFMMVPIIAISKMLTSRTMAICSISALTWAALHSLLVPVQVITILPQFFIFTLAFLVWDKQSRQSAFWVVISIHILNNLTVFLIGALSN